MHTANYQLREEAVEPRPAFLRAWWLAFVWAALIFSASTDTFSFENTEQFLGPIVLVIFPRVTEKRLEIINLMVRECAHLTEYFILYLLVYRAVSRLHGCWKGRWTSRAWVIAAVYATLDETHQIFVPSRTASVYDVIIDCLAVAVAVLELNAWHQYRGVSGRGLTSP